MQVRVVCQIAFVRRAFFLQNETVARRLFPWLQVKPSTPVAASPVVIMCNTKGKEEMDRLLIETGINPRRRLAMGSLSEDSSVTEGNGLTLEFVVREFGPRLATLLPWSFHGFFRETRTVFEANWGALRFCTTMGE